MLLKQHPTNGCNFNLTVHSEIPKRGLEVDRSLCIFVVSVKSVGLTIRLK